MKIMITGLITVTAMILSLKLRVLIDPSISASHKTYLSTCEIEFIINVSESISPIRFPKHNNQSNPKNQDYFTLIYFFFNG